MSLQERLTEDVKTAMKAREAGKSRLSVLRMVKASIRNIEIDRKKELNDEEVLDVLAKEVKMRRDSMEDFRKGNRPDLVAALEEEIAILGVFLRFQHPTTNGRFRRKTIFRRNFSECRCSARPGD